MFALEAQNNYLIYPKFWNLYNGGFVNKQGLPGLKKSKNDQALWKATLKLNNYKVINNYVGKKLYFITETQGDKIVRLAPSFYIIKDQKEYLVWWTDKKITEPALIKRSYISFKCNNEGIITGYLEIPAVDKSNFYCQPPNNAAPYLITKDTPINLSDIQKGLRTDWQHDIPGAYDISSEEKYAGNWGEVVFKRFYLGFKPPEEVLLADRDGWLKNITKKEQQILANEFGLNLVFKQSSLAENQYSVADQKMAEIKEYYQLNKSKFSEDYYFAKKNYISFGDNPSAWQVQTSDKTTEFNVINGKAQIKNKINQNSWFILKIGEQNDPDLLKEIHGPVRLSAEFDAEGLTGGCLIWQTVYIDVVQKDNFGQEIAVQGIHLPVKPNEKINLKGIFENEFIISNKTAALEVYLKISGCPTGQACYGGATVENLSLAKVLLAKNARNLDLDKLFSSVQALPKEEKEIAGKKYFVFNPAGIGLFIGERSFTIDKYKKAIEFQLKDYNGYSGFYSNIFEVSKLTELEVAGIFNGQLNKNGEPPDWANNTVEINYYDAEGNQVYPADYGAERYQKIFYQGTAGFQSAKNFFPIPLERGARYAQIKIHFLRLTDATGCYYDEKNYYTGKATVSNIIVRPALDFPADKNFAADGAFYKHINGLPISWSVKGVKVEEDIKSQQRAVVFENKEDNWSSLKAEYLVPDKATALRGYLNLDMEEITAGLGAWEGFGLFIEADVADQQGNIYHYTGIPVYQKIKDSLVRLERIPLAKKGLLEYYVPLEHEHLKVKKILWQLALLGKGRVKLLPLESKPNSDIVLIEFLSDGASANNPALWAQYGLYSSDNNGFTFQKNYELSKNGQTFNYQFAEVLAEHIAANNPDLSLVSQLKSLKVGETKDISGYKVKALPSYARIEKELNIEPDMKYLNIAFNLSSSDQAKYNFKALLLDKAGNTLEIPVLKKNNLNSWQKISADQDVFDLSNNKEEIIVPLRKKDFAAAAVRIIFGSNQGEIYFSNLKIYATSGLPIVFTPEDTKENYSFIYTGNNSRLIYEQKPLANLAYYTLPANNQAELDNRELEAADLRPFEPPINLNEHASLKQTDSAIRNSIKNNQAFCLNGQWYYAENKPFTPVGFTIVGETFNKWFELRRKEFKDKKTIPYWAKSLTETEINSLKNTATADEYIRLFFKVQAKNWQKMGCNLIRAHQIHASWSGLALDDILLTNKVLKQLQQEGFLIDYDLLPNPDFTNPYFQKVKDKKYARDFTNTVDLFKATLVLPEVADEYILPATDQICSDFQKINFWPNSISYCNETGFTRGFWTVDKRNSHQHPHFSKTYHYYYDQYKKLVKNYPGLNEFMSNGQEKIKNHIQTVRLNALLGQIKLIAEQIKQRQRVKDNAAYIYYNLLRADVLNSFNLYASELNELKNGFKTLAEKPANLEYYQKVAEQSKFINSEIAKITQLIKKTENTNIVELEKICRQPNIAVELQDLYSKVFAKAMPDDYVIPDNVSFDYIDSFEADQVQQLFFTSFLLPVVFQNKINSHLEKYASGKKFSIGLNNDYTKDSQALLSNTYLFLNKNNLELRFNKYTHHPVGGHNMTLHSGYGNIFDEDSAVAYNLELFVPLKNKYPARLSETNYTYAGGDNSGEGNWTIFDWLKIVGNKDQVLLFHLGRNNLDDSLISDYFDMGNRTFKLNALNLLAVSALAAANDKNYSVVNFKFDNFTRSIFGDNNKISGIAGTAEQGRDFGNQLISFKNIGQRLKVDLAITKLDLENSTYIMFYGIDRNNRQLNRKGNPDLVQSFGSSPISIQKFYGILTLKISRPVKNIFAITPSGEKHRLDLSAYNQRDGYLILDTVRTPKKATSFQINYK